MPQLQRQSQESGSKARGSTVTRVLSVRGVWRLLLHALEVSSLGKQEVGRCVALNFHAREQIGLTLCWDFPASDPVSRKNVKSAHSTRNRYSSQWTLTKCQASTPARTLTSDWRTVGSQHGITVTESDSYSASLSQDTGEPEPQKVIST